MASGDFRDDLGNWMVETDKKIEDTRRGLVLAGDATQGAWASPSDTISVADRLQIPAGGMTGGPSSGAPIRTRWMRTVRGGGSTVGNLVAAASNLRLEIGYLFRDQSNWEPSSGVMVTVRTTYMHGGSIAKCLIYGGYNRPWKIVPIECAGDQACFPFFSGADTALPHPYYERALAVDVPSYAHVTVEISTDIPFVSSRPFVNDPWKKILLTGVQTDLTAAGIAPQPHGIPWYTLGVSGNPSFAGSAAHFNAPGGGYFQVGYSRFNDKVRLRGLCSLNGLTGTVFTLPAGFRPEQTHLCGTLSSGGMVRLDIAPSGNVAFSGGTQSWLCFDNVEFGVHPTAA